MITVLGRATSSNVQAVMWCAAELGVAVDRRDYGGAYGGVDAPEYLALNPNGLVPTVLVGETPLWESAAVVRYLAAAHGDETFWPRDPLERARLDKWAEWGKVTLGAAFALPVFAAMVRQRPQERDEAALAAAIKRLQPLLGMLDAHLAERPFIGERFSFADIAPGHLLYRIHELGVAGDHPNLTRYYETLKERPAFREHVMVSFESLRPK